MFYVYVLKSLTKNIHYIGLTGDLDRRLSEHNMGKNCSTKSGRPWKLIHAELIKNREQARKLEKYFKAGFGREAIKEVELTIKYNPL